MNIRVFSPDRTECEKAWRREKVTLAIYSLKRNYGLKRIVNGGAESREK